MQHCSLWPMFVMGLVWHFSRQLRGWALRACRVRCRLCALCWGMEAGVFCLLDVTILTHAPEGGASVLRD